LGVVFPELFQKALLGRIDRNEKVVFRYLDDADLAVDVVKGLRHPGPRPVPAAPQAAARQRLGRDGGQHRLERDPHALTVTTSAASRPAQQRSTSA